MASSSYNPQPKGPQLNPYAEPWKPNTVVCQPFSTPNNLQLPRAGRRPGYSKGKRVHPSKIFSGPNIPSPPPRRTSDRTSRPWKKFDHGAKWVPKNKGKMQLHEEEKKLVIPFPSCPDGQARSRITTVMVKNIPNQFKRTDFLNVLKTHCYQENQMRHIRDERNKSKFDFVYLPMDFKRKRISNLGYAFVNFTSPEGALRFYWEFHNRPWRVGFNPKICEVTRAEIQGKSSLMANFRYKRFWCHLHSYLPVFLAPACDGMNLPKVNVVGKLAGKSSYYK
ncbi:protein MEI2-like 7 [Pyrus ussuriensis x Pyrus communis]|uniref:Protein MEI2-like 7 n=1 Tax=Pyrus ussuriensis x Pyrus communis TaxID=2448454 RepID=A0A5N5GU28_9ROSA|nr:protein MEI2-like 7 [Pyrus ussuriensis x Pyrus communis]